MPRSVAQKYMTFYTLFSAWLKMRARSIQTWTMMDEIAGVEKA